MEERHDAPRARPSPHAYRERDRRAHPAPELFGVFRKFFVSQMIAIEMKCKVLHAMGVLGALGLYTRKLSEFWFPPEMLLMRGPDLETKPAVKPSSVQHAVKNSGAQPDVYFQDVVFKSLLDILKDPVLLPYHTYIIKVVLQIFQQHGLKCVGFLPQVGSTHTTVNLYLSPSRSSQLSLRPLMVQTPGTSTLLPRATLAPRHRHRQPHPQLPSGRVLNSLMTSGRSMNSDYLLA